MKKNYIAPSMEITNVALQQMIAASDSVTVEGLDGFGSYGGNGSGKDPSSRRGGSVWDDDEDDWDY